MVLTSICNLRNQWFPPNPIFTEAEVPSQQGRVFIVTGGNGAVGYELCKILYNTGATIYMASRSEVSHSLTSPPTYPDKFSRIKPPKLFKVSSQNPHLQKRQVSSNSFTSI
jgi:hypothetical protein